MSENEKQIQFSIRDALPKLTDDRRYIEAVNDGNVEIGFYAPRDVDTQTPHTRDELYVVVEGRGMFIYDDDRHAFGPGDVLMVPAGVDPRFEDFTDDLMIWAIFYGPEGGHGQ